MSSILKSKAEDAEALQTIWEILSNGEGDAEAAEKMGLEADLYNLLKEKLLDQRTTEIRKRPIEHIFVEYMLSQIANIGELTDIVKKSKKAKQYNSAISAIRVRADLHDRILTKGQEFGVFKRTADSGAIDLSRMVADMTSDQIRITFVKAISEMGKMMRTFGDHSIIDATPGQIHYGEALPDTEKSGSPEIVVAPPSKDDAPKASKTGRSNMSKTSKAIRGRKAITVR